MERNIRKNSVNTCLILCLGQSASTCCIVDDMRKMKVKKRKMYEIVVVNIQGNRPTRFKAKKHMSKQWFLNLLRSLEVIIYWPLCTQISSHLYEYCKTELYMIAARLNTTKVTQQKFLLRWELKRHWQMPSPACWVYLNLVHRNHVHLTGMATMICTTHLINDNSFNPKLFTVHSDQQRLTSNIEWQSFKPAQFMKSESLLK